MNDPRELKNANPFEQLSSDEDEQLLIKQQLDEVERQKQDLLNRLKVKKDNVKVVDPNFEPLVQVEASPSKPRKGFTSEVKPSEVRKLQYEENPNEILVKNKTHIPSYSTSYFIENLSQSKKKQEHIINRQVKLLKARVHTFAGTGVQKEYEQTAVNEQDTYSGLWMKTRRIPQNELDKMLHSVKILRLNKLFAKVIPPKFTEPQYSNWVTLGVITKKDDIKFTSSDKPTKFLTFTISDFKYSLNVYIFGNKGVEKYYNLRIGDIVAILNPEILPWRPSGSQNVVKSFNLCIKHHYNCILEIGSSKDLGWCPVTTFNSKTPCKAPINKSNEKCCEFHRETQFRKVNSQRVELSGTYALGAPTKIDSQPALYRNGHHNNKFGSKESAGHGKKSFRVISDDRYEKRQENKYFDTRKHHFTSMNSAKAFFDDSFQNPDILENLGSKRRKLKDLKGNKKLDQELKKMKSPLNEVYEALDGGVVNMEAAKEATEAALQSGIIQRLGFDPTGGKLGNVMKMSMSQNDVKGNKSEKQLAMNDLKTLKKDTVNLKSSKLDQINRKRKREESWNHIFGSKKQHEVTQEMSSDSDLEILK